MTNLKFEVDLRRLDERQLADYLFRLGNAYRLHGVHAVGRSALGRIARAFDTDEDLDLVVSTHTARRLLAIKIKEELERAVAEVRARSHRLEKGASGTYEALRKDTASKLAAERASWKQYLKDKETFAAGQGNAPRPKADDAKAEDTWEGKNGWTSQRAKDKAARREAEIAARQESAKKATLGRMALAPQGVAGPAARPRDKRKR